jgi:serine/threonine protein kinase
MSLQTQIVTESTLPTEAPVIPATEYADLLQSFGVVYKHAEYYLQVGEMNRTQGWILHLSAVVYQVSNLLQVVVPFLLGEQVPFKIVANLAVAEDLLGGNLGVAQIGKIVTIYPEDDIKALDLAKKMVNLTSVFKGPAIPTDICLGHIVYTRYGAFNPVIRPNEKGGEDKFIYDHTGQLVLDPYAIPFQFTKGVPWPFYGLAEPTLPEPPKLFNRIYKVLAVLKSDCRGNVFQGLYLKALFNVKKCVLKQGFTNADSDILGRDIRDKLAWQAELYQELYDSIPMPEIYDFVREDAYSLLVMEYVKSDSLYHKANELNAHCKASPDLLPSESIALVNYGLALCHIISLMHEKRYIHRDIMPVNFIIDKHDRMFAIDLELAYSLSHKEPSPPFKLGTPGFASPEQLQTLPPQIDQDIYSLGATLLWLFTGLTPIKFNIGDPISLRKNLTFFIQNRELASVLANCLSLDPETRPGMTAVISTVEKYREQLQQNKTQKPRLSIHMPSDRDVMDTINAALAGLIQSPVVSANEYWYSKKTTIENRTSSKSRQYTRYPGISEGIAGPLYMLSRLQQVGLSIDICMPRFRKAWSYMEETYLTRITELSPGLYCGTGGLALAINEAIQSSLINTRIPIYKEAMQRCLELSNDKLDLAAGEAGRGVAILRCAPLLTHQSLQRLLSPVVDHLVSRQKKNGLWKDPLALDFGQGDTSILWFLLEYLSVYPDKTIYHTVQSGLKAMLSYKQIIKSFYNLIGSRASYDLPDGGIGIILMCLKAYETLRDDKYKQLALKVLLKYPAHIVHTNFSQQNGLAGLGEVYLEAWRVLQEDEWRNRAAWIASFFLHTFFRNSDSSGWWVLEENNPPTADFLPGISGIIHFLARYLHTDKIGYRLLK